MDDCRLVFFLECAFSIALQFKESAKTAFLQARKKLESAQKKSNYEDGLVRNLEMARDVLMNANQTHLERDLVQGSFFLLASLLAFHHNCLQLVGATLVDRVQILGIQEQKKCYHRGTSENAV